MVNGNFISVYENLAPDKLCDRLIERFKELEETSSACLGEDANGGLVRRKDASFYFEISAPNLASEVNVVLDQALTLYTDKYPSIGHHQFYSHCVKVQKTPPKGGFHHWHCEQSGRDGSLARILVWMIYLNDTPPGEGTTEFIEQGETIQPKKGSVVLFPASWTHTHRGNPVYTEDKFIATGWYYFT